MKKKMNDENFNYVLMCNKICGSSHYKMKLMVVVLDKAAYKAWYDKVSYNGKDKDKLAASKVWKNTYALTKPADAPKPADGGTGSDSTNVALVPAADTTKK
jgi:cytochrome c oxidase subunit 2